MDADERRKTDHAKSQSRKEKHFYAWLRRVAGLTDSQTNNWRRLLLIGGGLIVCCGLLALRYPLGSSLQEPRASWVTLVEPTWINPGYHLALYLGLTILYLSALRLLAMPANPAPPKRIYGLIISVWLIASLLLFNMAASGESHDIFDYIFRGRMMAELGANPLADTPISYRRSAYFAYLAWHSHVDTYGPVWEMSSGAVASSTRFVLKGLGIWGENLPSCPQNPLSCQMLIGYLTGYRLFAVGLTGLSAWLIASMVRRNRPQLVAAALVAWLWNPLLLIASAVGAHNDAVMIVLFFAALWLLQRQRWFLGLLALILAAHVKLTLLVLAPVFGLWLVRRCGWLQAIGYAITAAGIGLAISWLLYLPFDGWGTLPQMLYERSLFRANSIWSLLYYVLYNKNQWNYATVWYLTVQLPTWLFAASAVLASLWLFNFRPKHWQISPAPDWHDDRHLWRVLTVVSLLYLLVGSFWFQHWYVVWALAPAVLIADSRLTQSVLPWLSFGALAANVVGSFGAAMIGKGASRSGLYALIVALIWGPPALGLRRMAKPADVPRPLR